MVVPADVRLPDKFYEMCDVHGIMIIREFSGKGEEDLNELVLLSPHPSVGLVDIVGAGDDVTVVAENERCSVCKHKSVTIGFFVYHAGIDVVGIFESDRMGSFKNSDTVIALGKC